jgi:hypothetical protein
MRVVLISVRTAHPTIYTLYFINEIRNTYHCERHSLYQLTDHGRILPFIKATRVYVNLRLSVTADPDEGLCYVIDSRSDLN